MQLERVTAATMKEALTEVTRRLGSDAVILSTRTLRVRRWLGLRRSEVVEIMAGKGVNVMQRRTPPPAKPKSEPIMKAVANGAFAKNEYAAVTKNGSGSGMAAIASPPGASLLQTPAVQNVAMMNVANEVGALKTMVHALVKEVRTRSTPQVPDELFDHYNQLIQAEVCEEIATDILRRVQQHSRPEQLANPQYVKDRIVEQLEKLIPVSGPIERKKMTGPHIVALIGPTGVGKTTTIAKLAANLKLREKKSVGLITIDTYRIAAIDQLRKYADLIGIGLHVVASPDEIAAAIRGMADCDYILIDTAGRSPNDALKLNELTRFIEQANPDEVHLVLSTTCGPRSAELAMERFSGVRVDKIIFTKVDEAAQLGVLLSVVRKLNKSLSYVTNGQDVPDDIEVGHARKIARLILGDRS